MVSTISTSPIAVTISTSPVAVIATVSPLVIASTSATTVAILGCSGITTFTLIFSRSGLRLVVLVLFNWSGSLFGFLGWLFFLLGSSWLGGLNLGRGSLRAVVVIKDIEVV